MSFFLKNSCFLVCTFVRYQNLKKKNNNYLAKLKFLENIKFKVSKLFYFNTTILHFKLLNNYDFCFIDSLPSSMTCNINMLSDFFNFKNGDDSDWFLEDYNNIMFDKIRNTFDKFGKVFEFDITIILPLLYIINLINILGEQDRVQSSYPPMPQMDFSEILDF